MLVWWVGGEGVHVDIEQACSIDMYTDEMCSVHARCYCIRE